MNRREMLKTVSSVSLMGIAGCQTNDPYHAIIQKMRESYESQTDIGSYTVGYSEDKELIEAELRLPHESESINVLKPVFSSVDSGDDYTDISFTFHITPFTFYAVLEESWLQKYENDGMSSDEVARKLGERMMDNV